MIIDEVLILYSVTKFLMQVAQTLSEQRAFKSTSPHCVDNIQNYHVPYIMCKKRM